MTAVATLYEWPENAWAAQALADSLAQALADAGHSVPQVAPTATDPHRVWSSPELLLAQTCGHPFVAGACGGARLVATLHYGADGCSGPNYASAIIVRAGAPLRAVGDLAGRTVAINSRDSQSGCVALFDAVADALAGSVGALNGGRTDPLFDQVILTGAHALSLAAVAEGRAEGAAIDAVVWALARRDRPDITRQLKCLGFTTSVPGLPHITAGRRTAGEIDTLQRVLGTVLTDDRLAAARRALLIAGLSVLDTAAYAPLRAMAERVAPLVTAQFGDR